MAANCYLTVSVSLFACPSLLDCLNDDDDGDDDLREKDRIKFWVTQSRGLLQSLLCILEKQFT